MSVPVISIVIPTFRRPDSLRACLDRLEPVRPEIADGTSEIIVTDDDVDGAAQRMIAARHPGIQCISGPRRGPAANRNAGAAAARGEWLVFTDDDCLPVDGWLAAYQRAFASGHDVYEGRTTCEAGLTSPRLTAPVNLSGGNLWSCNFAIRRTVFVALGGFDERFPYPHMEDVDFRDRVVAAGYSIGFVPEATVDHPPRRLPWGTRLARIHRASVLYMVLHPPQRSLAWFVRKEMHMRLRSVIGTPKSFDTLSALASLPVELVAIATQWRAWHSWARRITAQ